MKRFAAALLAALLGTVIAAAEAPAATWNLSFAGCHKDTGLMGCPANAQGLQRSRGIVVSPDGENLYVAAWLDSAIVSFDRDPVTGALSNPSCIVEGPTPETTGCSTGVAEGLGGVSSIAVSPLGDSVYVGSHSDNAVAHFTRNTTTGALAYQDCVEQAPIDQGCSSSANGLLSPRDLAVSPEPAGTQLYVASGSIPSFGSGSDAVVKFDRGGGGVLTNPNCFEDTAAPDAGCGVSNMVEGLRGADSIVIAPNAVFVGSFTDAAVARFSRAPMTGALGYLGCIEDPPLDAGCAGSTAEGLGGTRGIAMSADGETLYAASETEDAVVTLDRDTTTNALADHGCVRDVSSATPCAKIAEGLAGATAVEVSPDGDSVYVASNAKGLVGDNALVGFQRDTSNGQLSGSGCIEDGPLDEGCGSVVNSLFGAAGLAVSPTGNSLYVAAELDDAITNFNRLAISEPPQAPAATPATLAPTAAPPSSIKKCKKKRKLKKGKCVRRKRKKR